MTSSSLGKRLEEHQRNFPQVSSYWVSAAHAFVRLGRPDRKVYLKTDLSHAKHLAGRIAGLLASEGPKSVDEPVAWPCDKTEQSPNEVTAFAGELASTEEWRDAARCVSQLSAILLSLMFSTDEGDANIPTMFETLGILAYIEARIGRVLTT